jgi:hypothetical protein
MSNMPVSSSHVLTSEERWSRWEQRGRDRDRRFMRRAHWMLWSAAGLAAVLLMIAALL